MAARGPSHGALDHFPRYKKIGGEVVGGLEARVLLLVMWCGGEGQGNCGRKDRVRAPVGVVDRRLLSSPPAIAAMAR
ncbi:hypothetical protein AXF42_Ash004953 [Apostasia shenzhenica]|uniref:Uncharacterized protein n=1 Tax=Apostasia shenzhenica TaxID=1088818 RepID=A0A2I0B818_9ASPA|nr:hypothetical protein AXF42_Ash004953 [Apostasia shenzhenica]